MKISSKGRYGLKAMVDLAVNSKNDIVTLKSIAERQSISEGYLEQVFSLLKKGGLVKSSKGAQGGYSLNREASAITIGDVLRALEGSLSVVDKSSDTSCESQMDYCIKSNVWDKLNESINKTIDSITLYDLTQKYNTLINDSSYIYYI